MKLLYILLLIGLFSCGTKKNESENKNMNTDVPRAVLGDLSRETPSTTINNAFIENGVMHLNVSYSGGCEDQTFELIGDKNLMKSMPPKRTLKLIRNNKGDNCRELITEDLKFDLSQVIYDDDPKKQIIFILSGTDMELKLISENQ